MKLRNVPKYLSKPGFYARKLAYKLYELQHPDEPWIAPQTVRFCERTLTREMRGFEWGSGRSTLWWAKHLAAIHSIDHDPAWFERVRQQIAASGLTNVTYELFEPDHPLDHHTVPVYEVKPRYVAAIERHPDASLDLVVVDGHYRQACVLAALPKIKPGRFLLIDNSDWVSWEEWGVPLDWERVNHERWAMGETSVWRKPEA